MSNVEKTVEKCQITLNMQKARLIFKLYCKHGKCPVIKKKTQKTLSVKNYTCIIMYYLYTHFFEYIDLIL
jgi:hypothetical protein